MYKKSILTLGLAIIAILLFIICIAGYIRERNKHMITTESALLTARKLATEFGFEISDMKEQHKIKWNTIVISFDPPPDVLGGNVIVVIDRTTGEVIESKYWQ